MQHPITFRLCFINNNPAIVCKFEESRTVPDIFCDHIIYEQSRRD